jgi:serine phosphatase RsbU (regulator of sigma subunit)/type II secretory pathway pseudopilin PulG
MAARLRFKPQRLTVVVLVVGVAVTAVLTTLSRLNYTRNEQHLVTTQTRLAALSISSAAVDLQRRLGRAATLAVATKDPAEFRQSIGPSIPQPFAGVVLYRVAGGQATAITTAGQPTMLGPDSAELQQVAVRAAKTPNLVVTHPVSGSQHRIGYAYSTSGNGGVYVAYGEALLPASRRVPLPADSPFGNVSFAIYYGRAQTAAALIETDEAHLPIRGTKAAATFQFGDTPLTLVLAPRGSMLGGFAQSVAPTIGILGLLFTALMALLAERLIRGRGMAQELAAANRRLYQAQRDVSVQLQHSLLPQRLPDCPQLTLAVRYQAGTEGIEIGGDWYDVVVVAPDRVCFTVGDVSGRGLEAATMMGALRNAINAYAVDGHDPATVLTKVSRIVDVVDSGRFATVLCGLLDLTTGVATIANAGHPNPILVGPDRSEVIWTQPGAPVGVGDAFPMVTVVLTPGTTLLAYTDGLVERRGHSISSGIDRLRASAQSDESLDRMLDKVLSDLIPSGPSDDVALLGMRWQS